MEAGRLDQAVALVFDNAATGEELWGVRLNGAAINGVEALIRLGRYDDADTLLARTGDRNVGICAPGPPLLSALLALRRGRLDDAVRTLDRADA